MGDDKTQQHPSIRVRIHLSSIPSVWSPVKQWHLIHRTRPVMTLPPHLHPQWKMEIWTASERHPNIIGWILKCFGHPMWGESHTTQARQPHESRPRFIEQFPRISFTNDMGSNLSDACCNLHLLASQVVSAFTKLKCMSWKPGPSGGIFEKIHHQPPDSNVEKLWL